MGQQNSYELGKNASLIQVQQLPIGKVYKEEHTQALYFIKEYAYTSQEAFQQAFIKFSAKLAEKNQNILNLQKTNTKVQNTFCSTFYKIFLIFEYIDYSLADQIQIRNKQNRNFEQRQIWSILFHCTLALAHLRRTQGTEHSGIGLKDIKLSQDGTIKIIPTEMIGIYNEQDLNEGTTKKLAMTILSCILMKQVSNQSNEYLQALIDKSKSSKQLKKVLYLMIMQDTSFLQLEQYLFKLSNDQNDSVLSGVATPVYSSHKKIVKQSNIKNLNQDYNNAANNDGLTCTAPQKEDQPHTIMRLLTNQIENPDENDEQKHQQDIQGHTQIEEQNTFAAQNNLQFKLKNNSHMPREDVTVRMIGKKSNQNSSYQNSEFISKPECLYTDPKLLDLIKKDLQEIQQKSQLSLGARSSIGSDYRKSTQQQQRPKRQSIYNMSSNDFNIKLVNKVNFQKPVIRQSQAKCSKLEQNPQGVSLNDNIKVQNQDSKSSDKISNIQSTFKQIQNIPIKKTKEQQCFGNILDEDASFKKSKQRKQVPKQSQAKRDLEKQNCYQTTQTKRIQSSTKKDLDTMHKNQQKKNSEAKLIPQQLRSNIGIQEESQMEFVNETYQKGQYKGYKLNGLRHGTGTFYYKQGGKYQGEWKQNKMNGKGILYYPNDQIAYQGNWKDDQLHGYGTLYNEEVSELNGSFQYQDWGAVEEYWTKYQGEFKMDNKEGKGKWYLSNGQIFQGNFKQDIVEGQGVLSRSNGSRVRGIWRNNRLMRLY